MVILKGVLFRKTSFLWDKSSPYWTQWTSVTHILWFGNPKGIQNMKSSVNSEYRMLLVFWGNFCKVPRGVRMGGWKNDGIGWTYLVINFVIHYCPLEAKTTMYPSTSQGNHFFWSLDVFQTWKKMLTLNILGCTWYFWAVFTRCHDASEMTAENLFMGYGKHIWS